MRCGCRNALRFRSSNFAAKGTHVIDRTTYHCTPPQLEIGEGFRERNLDRAICDHNVVCRVYERALHSASLYGLDAYRGASNLIHQHRRLTAQQLRDGDVSA